MTDLGGRTTVLPREDVFHLRGPSWTGVAGLDARLDLVRQDGAHPHGRIARQGFQRFDGQRKNVRALALRKARHQPGDLHRQFRADIFVVIVGQKAVGGGRRADIGGHRRTGCGRAVDGEILQHVGAGIAARRQFGGALRMAGADVQNVQRVAGIQARPVSCGW